MSSIYQELDALDRKLDSIEGDVDDVSYAVQIHDPDSEQLLNDSYQLKASTEAICDVTSTALNVLSSAQELINLTDSPKFIVQPCLKESDDRDLLQNKSCFNNQYANREAGSETDPQNANRFIGVWKENVEDENIVKSKESAGKMHPYKIISSGDDSNIMPVWYSLSSRRSRRGSELFHSGGVDHLMPADKDRTEQLKQIDQKMEIIRTDRRRHSSRRSLGELESESSDCSVSGSVIGNKKEQEIYLAASKVFTLEEYVRQLEEQVKRINEFSADDSVVDLEKEVANAVAKVTQTERKVLEIEDEL